MTVKSSNCDAIMHGKINVEPLREQPKHPSQAPGPTMAVTGVLSDLFVIVHMLGNLKIFAGREDSNAYATFPRTVGAPVAPNEGVLWVLRIVLLVAIVLHTSDDLALAARAKQSRGKFCRQGMMSSWNIFTAHSMVATGIVLLAFIILHLLGLTIDAGVAPSVSEYGEAYQNVVASFSRPDVVVWYITAQPALLLHLSYDLWTATPDLGITGKCWRKVLLLLSGLLPLLAVVNNILIPVAVLTGLVSQVEEEIYYD